ncbi:MAG TPA: hypothetical protein VN802_23275 [Stellaceae bacterium]|nr:hypothetical protein [Stellaceae bacterium]
MLACLSPNGQNLNQGTDQPARLLVATLRGIAVLERARPGAPWTVAARKLDGQHCSSLMIEPRRGGIFAGMHTGGLFFSPDGGETWEQRSRGITISQVFSVGYAHHKDGIALYAGTEPASMFRSDDYGATWVEQPGVKETKGREKWSFPSPPHDAHVKAMTMDPRDPNVIYAGVEQGDLLKTTDGGANWRVLDDFSKPTDWTYRDIHQVVVHPSNSAELYMTTGMGLYRSMDAGETWTLIVDNSFRVGYPDHLIVSPRDGDAMIMSGARANPGTWRQTHRAEGTIVRSTDRGRSWTEASRGLPQDGRANVEAMSVAGYPGGFTLFAGTTDGEVYASEDEAQSWTRIAGGLSPVSKSNHYRAVQPA